MFPGHDTEGDLHRRQTETKTMGFFSFFLTFLFLKLGVISPYLTKCQILKESVFSFFLLHVFSHTLNKENKSFSNCYYITQQSLHLITCVSM